MECAIVHDLIALIVLKHTPHKKDMIKHAFGTLRVAMGKTDDRIGLTEGGGSQMNDSPSNNGRGGLPKSSVVPSTNPTTQQQVAAINRMKRPKERGRLSGEFHSVKQQQQKQQQLLLQQEINNDTFSTFRDSSDHPPPALMVVDSYLRRNDALAALFGALLGLLLFCKSTEDFIGGLVTSLLVFFISTSSPSSPLMEDTEVKKQPLLLCLTWSLLTSFFLSLSNKWRAMACLVYAAYYTMRSFSSPKGLYSVIAVLVCVALAEALSGKVPANTAFIVHAFLWFAFFLVNESFKSVKGIVLDAPFICMSKFSSFSS